jgi:hypothetical protein
MPLALDPAETVPVYLKSDERKPLESRPVFIFHFLTSAESRKIRRLRREVRELKDDDASEAKVDEILLAGMVGWKNVNGRDGKPLPFSAEALGNLSLRDKIELSWSHELAISLAENELGKFDSPAESAAAQSASAAPPAV